MQKAVFAGGCFWCTEAIFKRLRGVTKVESGYSGGEQKTSYAEVSTGTTEHAEAVQVTFDPKKISYSDLLYVFFKTHDPTQKNRQGHDIGPQYRSAIFYFDEEQKKQAETALQKAQKENEKKVVTDISPFKDFYPAEKHHQDYYAKNPNASYCQLVIDPKIKKLERDFKDYLK